MVLSRGLHPRMANYLEMTFSAGQAFARIGISAVIGVRACSSHHGAFWLIAV